MTLIKIELTIAAVCIGIMLLQAINENAGEASVPGLKACAGLAVLVSIMDLVALAISAIWVWL